MDTSKEYIKMCEKAEEIQKNWFPLRGDCLVYKHPDYWENIFVFSNQHPVNDLKAITIWFLLFLFLPRQDQLQEMVRNMPVDLPLSAIGWIGKFYQWCVDEMEHVTPMKNSMEQLWLAFVMKEKYNKVWSGEEWVKWTQENA